MIWKSNQFLSLSFLLGDYLLFIAKKQIKPLRLCRAKNIKNLIIKIINCFLKQYIKACSADIMSGKLITRQIFGVRAANKHCFVFKDDHNLIYVSGNNVVVLNTETKDQSFISGTTHPIRSLGVTCISVSHHKKIIAICEKSKENGVVSFYDSYSLRRKKTINHSDLGSKEIVCSSFSDDGKYFAMQGGAPEWNLCFWNIEKVPKLLYTFKSCPHEDQAVSSISFCPYDNTVIAVFGKFVGKLIKYQEGM